MNPPVSSDLKPPLVRAFKLIISACSTCIHTYRISSYRYVYYHGYLDMRDLRNSPLSWFKECLPNQLLSQTHYNFFLFAIVDTPFTFFLCHYCCPEFLTIFQVVPKISSLSVACLKVKEPHPAQL